MTLPGSRRFAPARTRRIAAAGVATGFAGLLMFGIAHALLIVPIWSRLAGGIPFALLAGLTMAWWLEEPAGTHRSLPRALSMGAGLWLTLAPATFFAAALRVSNVRSGFGELELPSELIIAAAAGACAGWVATRLLSRAVAWAATTMVFTLLMGGPIPVTNAARAAGLYMAFLPICMAGAAACALMTRLLGH